MWEVGPFGTRLSSGYYPSRVCLLVMQHGWAYSAELPLVIWNLGVRACGNSGKGYVDASSQLYEWFSKYGVVVITILTGWTLEEWAIL